MADVHLGSDGLEDGYNIAEVRAGRGKLTHIEEAELGDISGQDVLHLQCHIGTDTSALAVLAGPSGHVTGVDFSSRSLEIARKLFDEAGLNGAFVESDVYQADTLIDRQFDLVFTGIGAINWLPDLAAWASVVAKLLKPEGRFYLFDAHPTALMFDEDADPKDMAAGRVKIRYPYFHQNEPLELVSPIDYADPDATLMHVKTYEWPHPLSDVINAVLNAGLTLDWVHEHDRMPWKLLPVMPPAERKLFKLPDSFPVRIPLSFSLSCRKPKAEQN